MKLWNPFDRRQAPREATDRRQRRVVSNQFCDAVVDAVLAAVAQRGITATQVVRIDQLWNDLFQGLEIRGIDVVAASGALIGAGLAVKAEEADLHAIQMTPKGLKRAQTASATRLKTLLMQTRNSSAVIDDDITLELLGTP